jgi:hypothetical protein
MISISAAAPRRSRALLVLILAGLTPFSSAKTTSSSKPTRSAMSATPEFTPTEVPARIADLAFSYLRPANFNVIDLPDEKPDFEKPTTFFPLQLAMAGYGAVLFSVAARPAYDDGSIQDWAEFLSKETNVQIISLEPGVLGGLPAVIVEVLQQTDAGVMRMRTALLEDGKRLINVSIMAPDAIWASVEPTLRMSFMSFRLAEPRGTVTPLTRAAAQKVAGKAQPAVKEPNDEETKADDKPVPAAELALADDAGTLNPDHPVNVRLRDGGAGLTPRVLEMNQEEKYAVIGAGAVVATFKVPFGWHAMDDGKRTLIFDAAGKIQISLNLRRDDGNHRALLEQIMAQARKEQPAIDPFLVDFAPDLPGLVLRNYRDGEDVLVQAFVVKQVRDDGLAHVARVTAAQPDMARAMNLAEVILRSLGPVLVAR